MRKRAGISLLGVLGLIAALSAPLVVVSADEAFSSAAIKNCIKALDRAGVDRADFRVIEASTSFAVEPYASKAARSGEAARLIAEGKGGPVVLGVFLTIRTAESEVEASCNYSAARTGLGVKGAMLDQVALDHLPVKSETISRWPVFSTGYLDRWIFFQPIDALVVSHN